MNQYAKLPITNISSKSLNQSGFLFSSVLSPSPNKPPPINPYKPPTTNNIACMQGMDSTQPDVYEMKTMLEAAKHLTDDKIFHSSLPEYMDDVKKSVDWDNLIVLKGERRTPRQLGTRKHLYADVTSTVKCRHDKQYDQEQTDRHTELVA